MSAEQVFIIGHALNIFMKIVCFILGYLTIRLGYKLIASGVKGEFKFSAKLGGVKTDLASLSPGLLFLLLGIFLIGYAIYVEKEINIEKQETGVAPVKEKPVIIDPDVAKPSFKNLKRSIKNESN